MRICKFLFWLPLCIYGQSPLEEFKATKELFPAEDYVITRFEQKMDLTIKKKQVHVTLHTVEEGICLSDHVVDYTESDVFSSSFYELSELHATSHIPDGSKYRSVEVKEFSEYSLGKSVFHDDSKTTKITFPQLTKGAKRTTVVTYAFPDLHILPSFSPPMFTPILKGRFELNVHPDIDCEVTASNLHLLDAQFSTKNTKSNHSHVWEFSHFEGIEYEENVFDFRKYSPQLLIRIKEVDIDGNRVPILNTLDDLHSWYCDFIRNDQDSALPIRALTDSITKGAQSDLEAAKRIYRWVQGHIKYIAIEDGYNGFKPEQATTVLNHRYGDCKGMSNLLHTMLNHYGLNSHLTWIGTRSISYTYENVPSPATDNHMIVALDLDDTRYFLDPTHSQLPFHLPSPFIQGKQALVSFNCDSFEIDKVSITPAEINRRIDSIYVEIHDNTLRCEARLHLSGYQRMSFEDRLKSIGNKDLKVGLRDELIRGSNKFILDSVWVVDESDHRDDLVIGYRFRLPDFMTRNENETYVNLGLDINSIPLPTSDDRTLPIDIEYAWKYTTVVSLKVDDLTRIESIPNPVTFGDDDYAYHCEYVLSDDRLTRKSEFKLDYLELPVSKFEHWNQFLQHIEQSNRNSVIIKQHE